MDGCKGFRDGLVEIRSNFECGNGENIRCENGVYHIDLALEPGEHVFGGKAYYFCIGIQAQRSTPASVALCFHGKMEGAFGAGTREVVVLKSKDWALSLPAEMDEAAQLFSHSEPDAIVGDKLSDSIRVSVDLPGADADAPILFLSNYHVHPSAWLTSWLVLMEASEHTSVMTFGTSSVGLPLKRIDIGREGAPMIVMAQTPQPAEMGTWAIRAIADFLVGESEEAESMRERFHFILLPETNPDGRMAGLGVSHPSGRMPYFEGALTVEHPEQALPEMAAVWQLIEEARPLHFIEWHSNHWDRRPGHVLLRLRPELIEDEERRDRWERIDETLLALPRTHHGNWTGPEEGMYQPTLAYQAATRLGTIAHMIKQHDKYSLDENLKHAVACLRILASPLD